MQHNPLISLRNSLLFLFLTVSNSGAVTIFINLPSNEQFSLDVEPSDSTENVKAKIEDRRGIVPENQYIYFNSSLLSDGRTLSDYNIGRNTLLQAHVVGPLAVASFSSYPALLNMSIRDAASTDGSGWMVLNYQSSVDFSVFGLASQTIALRSFSGNDEGVIAGFDPSQSYEWNFLTAPNGVAGFNAGVFTVDTTEFSNAFTGTFSVVQSSPQSLAIAYSAVPEPSTVLSGALGLLALVFRRKRS